MKKLLLALLFVASSVNAAPFVVSDPSPQAVTHCGIFLDSQPKVEVPVVSDSSGKYCKFDISGVTAGSHVIKATFINVDPVWGRQESETSIPLNFVRPNTPGAPTGLILLP